MLQQNKLIMSLSQTETTTAPNRKLISCYITYVKFILNCLHYYCATGNFTEKLDKTPRIYNNTRNIHNL